MTRKANGTVIKRVKNGTIKTLTTSGMIFLKPFYFGKKASKLKKYFLSYILYRNSFLAV